VFYRLAVHAARHHRASGLDLPRDANAGRPHARQQDHSVAPLWCDSSQSPSDCHRLSGDCPCLGCPPDDYWCPSRPAFCHQPLFPLSLDHPSSSCPALSRCAARRADHNTAPPPNLRQHPNHLPRNHPPGRNTHHPHHHTHRSHLLPATTVHLPRHLHARPHPSVTQHPPLQKLPGGQAPGDSRWYSNTARTRRRSALPPPAKAAESTANRGRSRPRRPHHPCCLPSHCRYHPARPAATALE